MSAKMESPSAEMKRLFRGVGGKARAGEKDDQLRARAMRRMNMGLADDRQITERRAKTYWYGEMEDIPSDHMDRARELDFVQPIQEAEDAIEHAIVHVEEVLAGLRGRLAGSAGTAARRVGTRRALAAPSHPGGGEMDSNSAKARLDRAFALARQMS